MKHGLLRGQAQSRTETARRLVRPASWMPSAGQSVAPERKWPMQAIRLIASLHCQHISGWLQATLSITCAQAQYCGKGVSSQRFPGGMGLRV